MNFRASYHLTSNQGNFTSGVPYIGHEQVMLGNENPIPIAHVYTCLFHIGYLILKLNNLLHVLNLARNLIFFRQLCIDSSVYVEFHPNGFYVKDLSKGTILLEGGVDKGLSFTKLILY